MFSQSSSCEAEGLLLVPRPRNARTPQREDPVTRGPRRRFDVVVNIYGPALGFSEWTNHSPCGCGASTEDDHFWEVHIRPPRKEGLQGP